MRYGIRNSVLSLLSAVLMCCGASVSAQVRYEDFSGGKQFLQLNGSASFQTYQGNAVLRLTDGGAGNPEASTVYFHNTTRPPGPVDQAKQQVAGGFITWFEFQMHNPTVCCAPGDGIALIIQNSTAVDNSYGASGFGFKALGAGGNHNYPNQAGAMGYAGINNNLVIEFDMVQDPWDPASNHIAIQTCGPATNTPVHLAGTYTIGNNNNVQSCLFSQQSINSSIPMLGGVCNESSCADGKVHQAVIGYTPPSGNQQGMLQIWLDPTFVSGTHTPSSSPLVNVPYNIVYNAQSNPRGLNLDTNRCSGQGPCGYAWVGFTASQPNEGTAQDILGWEFTLNVPVQVQQVIQPGGTPTVFAFGAHVTTVTYPAGFQNANGILMTVTATPTSPTQFHQTRLLGTNFADEECITYLGTEHNWCTVYSYTCQDQHGNPVTCPAEPACTNPQQSQCIAVNTTFYTDDKVTPTNADYLENDAVGDNNWMSIFTSYVNEPIDGTTSGGSKGFGGGGLGDPSPASVSIKAGQVGSADIVATFNPNKP